MQLKLLQIMTVSLQLSVLVLMVYFLYSIIRVIRNDVVVSGALDNMSYPFDSNKYKQSTLEVLQKGMLAGEHTELSLGDITNIGRGEHNDIVIHDSTVSHEHACIT